MQRLLALLAVAFAAATLHADTVIGSLPQDAAFSTGAVAPLTLIDLAHPATENGTISYVTLRWSGSGCANAMRLKVLRPSAPYGSFTVVGERGPYNVSGGRQSFAIAPAITVVKGDYLAVVQLQTLAKCGGVALAGTSDSSSVLLIGDDVSSGFSPGQVTSLPNMAMSAVGTNPNPALVGVIPAVGSLAGSFGSFFRTSLQLTNPDNVALNGRLTFHRAGVAASSSDPFMAFTIDPNETISFDDVVATMNQSGLGTLDISTERAATPVVLARVYTDQGAAGTKGFTEDFVPVGEAMHAPQRALLQFPSDPANFRMNVGIRTFGAASITFTARAKNGDTLKSIVKAYSATIFEQTDAAALVGLSSVPPDGTINVYVTQGTAVVYGSYTDNRTNDSTVKYAGR